MVSRDPSMWPVTSLIHLMLSCNTNATSGSCSVRHVLCKKQLQVKNITFDVEADCQLHPGKLLRPVLAQTAMTACSMACILSLADMRQVQKVKVGLLDVAVLCYAMARCTMLCYAGLCCATSELLLGCWCEYSPVADRCWHVTGLSR